MTAIAMMDRIRRRLHLSGATSTAWLLAMGLVLPACDILDVDNPNNLVEESIHEESAAEAVVNGASALVAEATSSIWQPLLIATDELYWVGSRDAWLQLDQGFISDVLNEFTDGAFPDLGAARWMADEAVDIMEEHIAENPSPAMKLQQARAYFYSGAIYMIIGEVQQDFAFSDKQEPGPAVGADQMFTVLDQAITKLDKAIAVAQEIGNSDLETRALAVRARAKHSRAIWDKIKPTPNTADPLVSDEGASADAQAVLDRVSPGWRYQFLFSSETITNEMASWINDRAENQFDLSLVSTDATGKILTGVIAKDVIDDVIDPVVTAKITEFKGGDVTETGFEYPPLTVVSDRLMHLILAEDALATGDDATFTTHINHVRSMDGLTPYSGQISALEMLTFERRVNLLLMGLRLNDMYRFGIQDDRWEPNSEAVTSPGTLLPITITEIRANPLLGGGGG